MFKKFKINANIFILLYDAFVDTIRLISQFLFLATFIYSIGYIYDLSFNPVFEVDYRMTLEYCAVSFYLSIIFWIIHKVFCLLRFKFVNKITSAFPMVMRISDRIKK